MSRRDRYKKGLRISKQTLLLGDLPQPEVLRQKMELAGIRHEQKTIVNLKGVQVRIEDRMPRLYFCPMESVEIISVENEGDTLPLPQKAVLEGAFPGKGLRPGLYNINNVMLYPNGKNSISLTATTSIEPIEGDESLEALEVQMYGSE